MSVLCTPPYTPLLYSKTGVYRGICYFLIFALKHRLWVLVLTCTHNLCFVQKYENSQDISTENCHFYSCEKSLYVAWACFRNVLKNKWLHARTTSDKGFNGYSQCMFWNKNNKLMYTPVFSSFAT